MFLDERNMQHVTSFCHCQTRNAIEIHVSSNPFQMPINCRKDPTGLTCTKENNPPEKSTEAELWLNMMSSMLNFAMASTTLMKGIQNRMEVTKKMEEEARAMRAEEFFRKELVQSMADFKGDSDFSLRSEPVREDTCGEHTCTLFPKKNEPDEGFVVCGGKNPAPKKVPKPRGKKRKPVESVGTIGGSCECLTAFPAEEPVQQKKDEVDDEEEEEESKTDIDKDCICEPEENEEIKVEESSDEGEEKNDKLCEPEVICPATRSFAEQSEDCSCPSLYYKQNIDTEQKVLEEPAPVPTEEPPEEIQSIQDCACQTTSSEEIMAKELQLANLSYQLRQTDRNLKELKKEMDRISNFVGGKKRSHYDTSAALYEEIMKPRTSVEGAIANSPRKRR